MEQQVSDRRWSKYIGGAFINHRMHDFTATCEPDLQTYRIGIGYRGGFLKWGNPKTMGFNNVSILQWYHQWSNLGWFRGYPYFLNGILDFNAGAKRRDLYTHTQQDVIFLIKLLGLETDIYPIFSNILVQKNILRMRKKWKKQITFSLSKSGLWNLLSVIEKDFMTKSWTIQGLCIVYRNQSFCSANRDSQRFKLIFPDHYKCLMFAW